MQQPLFLKYGSRITSGLAEQMYDRVLVDPDLAHFFVHVDTDILRDHVADFLSVVTGGPDIYRGRDIRKAHSNYKITKFHFDRLLTHIAAAADDLGIEPQDSAIILQKIREVEADIVNT